jgi:hypothetical protein
VCTESLTQHIKHQIDDFLDSLSKQFKVEQVEVGGIDFSVWKIYLRALYKCGEESVDYPEINMALKVVNSGQQLVNEVKRVGVIIDRGQEMQFRGGDQLIIYVSMGGYEK